MEEMEEMLKIYSNEGSISCFKDINLSETQVLGSFIRDEKQIKKLFSNYRKCIDFGIIRKDSFDFSLKEYKKRKRVYPRERNAFIVPELLPELQDSKLKISLTPDLVWKIDNPITREKFQDLFLIIFGPDEILDILLIKEKELGFRFIGTERDSFLVSFIQQQAGKETKCEKEVEEIFHPEKQKKSRV
eukprot:snap_masked-scaffold_9-processed-gene-13.82-mRNA-1 protein AED:1.00 eAED:1.00 QI:0/0/0/0/1/1/5/0/187